MKTVLVSWLLVAGLTPFLFGQGRFSVSATVSPTQHRQDIWSNYYDSTPTVYSSNVLAKDKGFSAGLSAHYQFHRNWSVSSGLWYNRSTGYLDFQAFKDGAATGYEPTRRTVYNTLQLPVLVNFSPSRRRLSPYLSTGFVFSMNYRSRIGPYFDRSVEPATTHSDEVNTNVLLGLGAQYRINSRWAIIVQPTVLYRLQNLKPNSGDPRSYLIRHDFSHYRDWQLGVQAQVKYTF